MRVYEANGGVVLSGTAFFNLEDTFECGQCFRWDKQPDGSYTGVAMGRALAVCQQGVEVFLRGAGLQDYKNIWERYFDLARDYKQVRSALAGDCVMDSAMAHGEGIRLLAQEPFETLISFIISANNHIPRIKQIIARLCESWGEPIAFEGKRYYTFPTPQAIAGLRLKDLSILKAGYRDSYILEAARAVADGDVDLAGLCALPFHAAKAQLLKIKGVGNKVADCILLYGLGRHEAFPADVWIRRVMGHFYLGGACGPADIGRLSAEKFGAYGGFAQQYLFYYARELKIAK